MTVGFPLSQGGRSFQFYRTNASGASFDAPSQPTGTKHVPAMRLLRAEDRTGKHRGKARWNARKHTDRRHTMISATGTAKMKTLRSRRERAAKAGRSGPKIEKIEQLGIPTAFVELFGYSMS